MLPSPLRAALLWVCTSASLGCTARVAGSLDEPRANEALGWLEEHGVAATKVEEAGRDGTFALEVRRGELGTAVRLLDEAALPRRRDPGIAETYAEATLVPSPSEDRARYESAIAGELARTLEGLPGVVDARVHLTSPPRADFALDEAPPAARASVLVSTRPGHRVDPDAVRSLVVGAVDGLAPEAVSVVVSPVASRVDARSRFARVGPFQVSPSSALPLTIVLGASLAAHVVTALLTIVAVRRRRAASV